MKLEFLSFDFDKFAQEMQNLKDKKGFDYLVTIVGPAFIAPLLLIPSEHTKI